MKSWIILIVAAVGLSAAATVAVPLFSPDKSKGFDETFVAPTIKADEQVPSVVVGEDLTHQFGLMPQEVIGTHTWTFTNNGPGNLELRDEGTDCQCTNARLGKVKADGASGKAAVGSDGTPESVKTLMVPPGQSEPITLTWKTNRADGHYRKLARIGTNDPRRPQITLVIDGTVRPSYTLFPPSQTVQFKTVGNDEPVTQRVALTSGDRPETKVIKVESSTPSLVGIDTKPLTPEELKLFKVETGFAIEITVKPTANLGAFAEEVVITTDHPTKPEVRLKVLGKVAGPITMVPDKVLLRDVTASQGGGEEVILWVRGQDSVKFEVVKKPEAVEVAFDQIPQPAGSKGSKYKMTVKIPPGTPTGVISDEIVVKTDHPKASEIRVPLDILIQSAR